MKKIALLGSILSLIGCSWPHIAATYGSRYGFNVSGAVYAEMDDFKIVDRPDLKKMFVTAPVGIPQLKYQDAPDAFETVAYKYLSLDRQCKIKTSEEMLISNVEYIYTCEK